MNSIQAKLIKIASAIFDSMLPKSIVAAKNKSYATPNKTLTVTFLEEISKPANPEEWEKIIKEEGNTIYVYKDLRIDTQLKGKIVIPEKSIKGVFENCTFEGGFGGTFTGSRFTNGTFNEGTFADGKFIDSTFKEGTFEGGAFTGGTFEGRTFAGGTFESGTFTGGTFEGGTFKEGTFEGGAFTGGTFEGGTFKAKFSGGKFSGGKFKDGTWIDGTWEASDDCWLGGWDKEGIYHPKGFPPSEWKKQTQVQVQSEGQEQVQKQGESIVFPDEPKSYTSFTGYISIIPRKDAPTVVNIVLLPTLNVALTFV